MGLIDSIRSVMPARVYVAIDGPRPDKQGEEELTKSCREAISQIDWPCRIVTNFRDRNLGCGRGVSDAITWFFQHEEAGVILEDDVRVHPSFFPFCEELLERYREEPHVCAISGCNFTPVQCIEQTGAYRFTRIPHVWGWATWRRAWADYQYDMRHWRQLLPLQRLGQVSEWSAESMIFWSLMFELLSQGIIDTWDYQFIFMALRTGALTATSNVNLVTNVGIGRDATHTRESPAHLPPPEVIHAPFSGPDQIAADKAADRWVMRNVMGATVGGIARQGSRFLWRQLRKVLG